jgi:hypothetical protein
MTIIATIAVIIVAVISSRTELITQMKSKIYLKQ